MNTSKTYLFFVTIAFLAAITFTACNSHMTLIERQKTEYGTVKFYFQTYENVPNYKHVVAKTGNLRFDVKRDFIFKQTGEEGIFYELVYDESKVQKDQETLYNVTPLDSLIFQRMDEILDSLNMDEFPRAKGSLGYVRKNFAYELVAEW